MTQFMTSEHSFAIAIMAAGKGTRLKSKRPKVLHEIGGKPLLMHVIAAAANVVRPEHIYVIVGHEAEKVTQAVAHTGVNFILQADQRGTGHAVQCAQAKLEKYGAILVLSGDAPLIRPETICRLRDFHLQSESAMTILSALPEDPYGYGRVILAAADRDEVLGIVEQKALPPEKAGEREINSGIYAFASAPLYANIHRLTLQNAHGEFYLTDMAALLVAEGFKVMALRTQDPNEVLGANTIAEMMQLDASIRLNKARELMAAGVTIFRPETCVIDGEVSIGADTVIEPFVQLLGDSHIGEDCRIRSYATISNSVLGDRVTVRQGCVIDKSRIDHDAVLGPYAHLRPASQIGAQAHVGNFVETKNTRLGQASKANHLSYLGDAEIGAGVNIGAGTITCNYDGVEKHMTIIEDNVFVGSDSTLVAPVRLGKCSYVGASSCITEDVPEESLAIGRARQTTKKGWVRERRESASRKPSKKP